MTGSHPTADLAWYAVTVAVFIGGVLLLLRSRRGRTRSGTTIKDLEKTWRQQGRKAKK